jgi:hypothetical protein
MKGNTMNTLTITRQAKPGFGDYVAITATVTMKSGKEVTLCNPFTEVQDAIAAGEPFTAHAVVGMKPSPVVINPAHVALVESR